MRVSRPSPAIRGGASVVAATALVLSAIPAGAVASPQVPGDAGGSALVDAAQVEAPVPALDWQPCGEGLEEFLCTTAQVPTDYDDPEGATTTIALTKLPAADSVSRIGSLFTNPGGPGGSGVDFIQQAAFVAFTPELRASFDIIGFDPRTVSRSDPATCFPTAEDEAAFLADQPAFPVTAAEERRFISDFARLGAHCRTTSRERFEHASTANVARDMDLLRQAVGDEKLTYFGYSYGTFLGATYARLFPDRVRAMTLDGALNPSDFAGRTGNEEVSVGVRIGQGPGADDTFGEFLRLCADTGPDACALAAAGDPETVVDELFERLKTEPAVVELPDGTAVEISYATAVAMTFSALYSPAGWADHAELLAMLAAGENEVSAEAATALRAALPGERGRRGEDYASVGGSMSTMCADTGSTGSPFDYPDMVDAADDEAPHFGRYRAWVGINCEFHGLTDDDAYLGPWEQDVEAPVLVIGTRHDPATPYPGTEPFAERFPDARVLTLEGWGHTTIAQSTCADDAVTDYLVALDAPADGTSCDPDVLPFDADSGRQANLPGAVRPGAPLPFGVAARGLTR